MSEDQPDEQPSNRDELDTRECDPDGVDEARGTEWLANEESSETSVTPRTVGELHRRILSVSGAVTDAESHLSMVAELVGHDAYTTESSIEKADVAAELEQLGNQLDQAAKALQQAQAGTDELFQSASRAANQPVDREHAEVEEGETDSSVGDTESAGAGKDCTDGSDECNPAAHSGLLPVDDDIVRNTATKQ